MDKIERRWYFHWIDWAVLALMPVISSVIGLWYYKKSRQVNTKEYLLGDKNTKLFPVSASLVASFISGITIIGTPWEIYNFGTQYWITIISLGFSSIVVVTVYLPVFTRLKLNSVYEYLELRFNKGVRILISLFFVVNAVTYASILIYIPGLAFNQVTGKNSFLIGCIVCLTCVFYTILGGFRAIVWVNTIQLGITVSAVLVITGLGTYQAGGPALIWRKATEARRIEFLNFDSSPYTRHTVWSVLIGSWLYSTAYVAVNQTMVQRYQSLPTTKTCKQAVGLFTVGLILFISLCCWCGLVMVAWWTPPKCDPRAIGRVVADEQLLLAFVMEIADNLHGIPGLFIAGILGTTLSLLSIGFNSIAIVLVEDFIKGCFKINLNETRLNIFVKSLIGILGIITLGLTFLIEKFGEILYVANSFATTTAGVSFGVFTLGLLFPWINSEGAFVGGVVGFIFAGFSSLGSNIAVGSGIIIPKILPVQLGHCPYNVSQYFLKRFIHQNEDDILPLYRMSYHWYAGLGTVIVIIIGGAVSWFTSPLNPSSISKDLLSPVIHRWLPEPKVCSEVCTWRRKSTVDRRISSMSLKGFTNIHPQNNARRSSVP